MANNVNDIVVEPLYDTIGAAGVMGVGGEAQLIYQAGQKQLEQQERAVSRIAILGVFVILLTELINGRSLIKMFSGWQ